MAMNNEAAHIYLIVDVKNIKKQIKILGKSFIPSLNAWIENKIEKHSSLTCASWLWTVAGKNQTFWARL